MPSPNIVVFHEAETGKTISARFDIGLGKPGSEERQAKLDAISEQFKKGIEQAFEREVTVVATPLTLPSPEEAAEVVSGITSRSEYLHSDKPRVSLSMDEINCYSSPTK